VGVELNLTSKSRYALKIMLDLAHHDHLPHVPRKDIARRQRIPQDYLDQIMIRLRRGNIVESIRGRSGGYRLAKPAKDITVWELFEAVEGNLEPVQCIPVGQSCDLDVGCLSQPAWKLIFSKMKQSLEGLTIGDLVGEKLYEFPEFVTGVSECRAPVSSASL